MGRAAQAAGTARSWARLRAAAGVYRVRRHCPLARRPVRCGRVHDRDARGRGRAPRARPDAAGLPGRQVPGPGLDRRGRRGHRPAVRACNGQLGHPVEPCPARAADGPPAPHRAAQRRLHLPPGQPGDPRGSRPGGHARESRQGRRGPRRADLRSARRNRRPRLLRLRRCDGRGPGQRHCRADHPGAGHRRAHQHRKDAGCRGTAAALASRHQGRGGTVPCRPPGGHQPGHRRRFRGTPRGGGRLAATSGSRHWPADDPLAASAAAGARRRHRGARSCRRRIGAPGTRRWRSRPRRGDRARPDRAAVRRARRARCGNRRAGPVAGRTACRHCLADRLHPPDLCRGNGGQRRRRAAHPAADPGTGAVLGSRGVPRGMGGAAQACADATTGAGR